MTVVFVHGVPETSDIWTPLLAELGLGGAVCLSPPGFGEPSPDGWEAHPDTYAHWLLAELEKVGSATGQPIDLVGHDWGGGHVVNALTRNPTAVRSWVSDIVGIFHPDYVWHDMAQVWRTPEEGEAQVATMAGTGIDDKKALLAGLGLASIDTASMARWMNADMGRCILGLYRGAGPDQRAAAYEQLPKLASTPGLAIVATNDGYVGAPALALAAAERAGAEVCTLEGLGHWWMVEDPARSAAALTQFWRQVA